MAHDRAPLFPHSVLILCRPHFALILEPDEVEKQDSHSARLLLPPPPGHTYFVVVCHLHLLLVRSSHSSICPYFCNFESGAGQMGLGRHHGLRLRARVGDIQGLPLLTQVLQWAFRTM